MHDARNQQSIHAFHGGTSSGYFHVDHQPHFQTQCCDPCTRTSSPRATVASSEARSIRAPLPLRETAGRFGRGRSFSQPSLRRPSRLAMRPEVTEAEYDVLYTRSRSASLGTSPSLATFVWQHLCASAELGLCIKSIM